MLTNSQFLFMPVKMHTIDTLMSAMDKKIKQARDDLSHGFHDPLTMEEIDIISNILHKYISYENVLKQSNMDVD